MTCHKKAALNAKAAFFASSSKEYELSSQLFIHISCFYVRDAAPSTSLFVLDFFEPFFVRPPLKNNNEKKLLRRTVVNFVE